MKLILRRSRQSVHNVRSKMYDFYTYSGFVTETGEVVDFVVMKGGREIMEGPHNRLLFERFRKDLCWLAKDEFEAIPPKR